MLWLGLSVVLLVWFLVVVWRTFRQGDAAARVQAVTSDVRHVEADGAFNLEIVGESRYQQALEQLAGGRQDGGVQVQCTAALVLEDSNPHDAKAVRVDIEGRTVGYLTRRNARDLRAQMARIGVTSTRLTTPALIVGGWTAREGEDPGYFGVKLDLPMGDD